jgi:hypothetical protein
MPNMSECIRNLLQLERELPESLADELRLGNRPLLDLHDDFIDIASEIRVWSIYETIDSLLSGSGSAPTGEVEFSAPLVSIKSSLLGIKQERVLSVDSDHANCAAFGPQNPKTMESYIEKLSAAVTKAERLSDMYTHTPLRLKEHVKIELVSFYEDPDATMESAIRLYSAKIHLDEFLIKGPERCLEERLSRVPTRTPSHPVPPRSRTTARDRGNSALGIWPNVQKMFEHGRSDESAQSQERSGSPGIVITGPSRRPSLAEGGSNSMPAVTGRRGTSRTVPPLETPDYNDDVSTKSEPTQEVSPTAGDPPRNEAVLTTDSTGSGILRTYSDTGSVAKPQGLRDFPAGFSRPDPLLRKFMWIHVPFTNPLWVQVREDGSLW